MIEKYEEIKGGVVGVGRIIVGIETGSGGGGCPTRSSGGWTVQHAPLPLFTIRYCLAIGGNCLHTSRKGDSRRNGCRFMGGKSSGG